MSIVETPAPKESKVLTSPSSPSRGQGITLRLRSSLQQLLAFGVQHDITAVQALPQQLDRLLSVAQRQVDPDQARVDRSSRV